MKDQTKIYENHKKQLSEIEKESNDFQNKYVVSQEDLQKKRNQEDADLYKKRNEEDKKRMEARTKEDEKNSKDYMDFIKKQGDKKQKSDSELQKATEAK